MDNLLPCPFCGGDAELITDWRSHFYGLDVPGVQCAECGVRNFEKSEDQAVKSWNTRRAKPDQEGAMIDTDELRRLAHRHHLTALMEVADELDGVRAERDDHEQARTALEEELAQVWAERAALAAHVERLHKEAENAMAIIESRLPDWEDDVEGLRAELDSAPAASLARLIAEKQAEILHLLAEKVQREVRPEEFITCLNFVKLMQETSDHILRRQAEEGSC